MARRSERCNSARACRAKSLRRRGPRVAETLEPRALLATDLVISELLASNVAGLADEDGAFSDWIEIRNTAATAVDLAGWSLTDESDDLDKWLLPAQSLDAGGYLVVFASGKDRATAGDELHTNFKLSNNGEYLALVRPGEVVADEYTPDFPEQYDDISYGASVDLATRGYFPAPTPGAANSEPPIADPTRQIVIHEIMYHPQSESDAEEYIELYNKGLAPVNLAGWKISSGVTFTFPSATIGIGQYLAVAANLTAFQAKYPGVTSVVAGWTGSLSNSGEAIEITDAAGLTIDRVEYADEGDWAVRGVDPVDGGWTWLAAHDGGAQSLELVNWRLSNNYGSNWRASSGAGQGTPAAPNTQAQVNSPPLVVDVEHFPIIPRATENVTVTARILDEATTGLAVTAFFKPGGSPSFSSVVMNDAGTGADAAAGDGTFSVFLPLQVHNTVVEYYVQAKDAFNATRTWPAPTQASGQVTNAMYQVDNNYSALAPWDPNTQPIYRLIMTPADYTAIARSLQISRTNAQTNATFVVVDGTGSEVHHLAGVRFRGNSSRSAQPPPLRIEFPEDNRFNSDDNINVNSRSAWLQLAGSAVFRLAGLPAAETIPVQVRINGTSGGAWGAPNGSYARMEVLDAEFLDRAIPEDSGGNLYKKVRSPSNPGSAGLWAYRFGDAGAYQADGWIKQTNTGQNDWSDLDQFLNVMNNTTAGPGYFDAVNAVIDVDQWVRWLAVMQILNTRETNLSNGADDDYQMYRGEIDQRFILVPHDLDNVFGQGDGGTVQPTWHGIFQPIALQSEETAALDNLQILQLERFFEDPEIIRRYYATLRELVTTVFSPERLNPLLDDALASFVPQTTIDAMKTFAAAKNAHVLSLIPSQFSLVDGLPVVDGYPRTISAGVPFTGTADAAQVQSVTVDGQLATWNAHDGTWILEAGGAGTETLLPTNTTWRYLTDGSNQGTAWRATGFNDSTWPIGTSEFGYGDGDETTSISNTRTTYFRKAFSVQNSAAITSITANILRDDGAVVYLNGAELFRTNMPTGTINNTTRASSAVTDVAESTFFPFTFSTASLPPGVTLSDGTNVIAVELHQRAFGTDGDGSFNFTLTAERTTGPLKPGINRVLAQAFTGANGGGEEVWRELRDIWYDDGSLNTVSTNLPAGVTTTWTAAAGPYHVTADISVPASATLVIQPGTTVFFNAGTGLTVNGTLQAVGNPQSRIRFTRLPSAVSNWDGIRFVNSTGANQLAYFDQAYGDVNGRSIQATGSVVSIDNGEWFNTIRQILDFGNSSFSLTNSVLPDIQNAEMVHMSGFPAAGFVLIQGNVFGRTTGFNDIIDLTGGNRPGPIAQILDNVFLGSEDDILDLDGTDAHIEGNVFMDAHLTEPDTDTSSAISGGADSGNTSELTIVRNFFYDLDHAVLVKEGNSATLVNNTMHHITVAAINFEEPGNNTAGPGLGATLDGNIISDTPLVFQNTNLGGSTTQIVINRTLTPAGTPYSGIGNLVGVAKFVKSTGITDPSVDLLLALGSPGTAAGPNGVDMGAGIPGGATISGEPPVTTPLTEATLTVGGPDIFGYKFRVNGGAWSAEQAPGTPIFLSGLANGAYTVHVAAKNSAGFWQPDAEATASRTWTVNTAHSGVQISEVLASNVATFANAGTFPDVIELVNVGASDVDLAGMSISDTSASPAKFVFPSGTVVLAGQRLLLFADSATAAPGIHLGFSLDATGEGVYLYSSPGSGGTLVDSVAFGPQLADLSIGRVGHDGHWALNTPTLGAANVERFTGETSTLKINEWFASGLVRFDEDYLELYNPDPQPVNLAGLYLSDDPAEEASFYQIPALSFVRGAGFIKFVADGNLSGGGDHLPFSLSSDLEMLGLYTNLLQPIDEVLYFSQTTDISQGLNPDGGTNIQFYSLPTPDVGNPPPGGQQTDELITFGSVWSFLDNGTDQETSWRLPGFNDASWVTGPAQLGYGENDQETVVSFGPDQNNVYVTTYFRRHLTIPAGVAATYNQVSLDVLYDDGVCIYVNGVEIGRTTNLPGTVGDASVLFDTYANFNGATARENQVEGFIVPLGLLQDGDNVIAVEVHQINATSSDLSFDLALRGTRNVPPPPIIQEALDFFAGLRITEIMYNPANPTASEYLEVQNVGAVPLPIGGVRISGGVSFTFPAMTLAPGQRTVVVADLAAFRAQYGTTIPVAGVFADSLSNGGERLILQMAAPYEAAALRFDYRDDWFPTTDGGGYSLVVANTAAPAAAWDERSTWQESAAVGGSPGRSETDPAPLVLTVNPLETSDTTPPLSGTVNYPAAPVTVNVGGQDYPAVNHGDGTWSLADNVIAPLAPAVYDVHVSAPDGLGNIGSDVTVGELSIEAESNASVAGRHIFYNQSAWDGNSAAINVTDNAAIATDKSALLPGGTGTFANYISYDKGINGLMIDLAGTHGAITAADLAFKTGNVNNTASWTPLGTAPTVDVRVGGGGGGSDRITLTFPTNTVRKTWLQVRVLANANTNLAADDVFYFGNAVGEVGDTTVNALVNATDEIQIRANPRNIVNPAPVDFKYDIDRNKLVNATDQILARSNTTNIVTALRLIVPTGPAPGAEGLADAALAGLADDVEDILANGRRRK